MAELTPNPNQENNIGEAAPEPAPRRPAGCASAVGAVIVFIAALFWPERIAKVRTVEAIRQRIESEDDPPPRSYR
ncbi:hypothetical protein [Nocardia sp. CA-135398]|uniref:hypothetical protein n=1 Tax=Nocardia sp. CA-135398 TaxID=3239977 RepID=UPI003D993974